MASFWWTLCSIVALYSAATYAHILSSPNDRLSLYIPQYYSIEHPNEPQKQELKAGSRVTFCVRFNQVGLTRPIHKDFDIYFQRLGKTRLVHWRQKAEVLLNFRASDLIARYNKVQLLIGDYSRISAADGTKARKLKTCYKLYKQAQECLSFFNDYQDPLLQRPSKSPVFLIDLTIPRSIGRLSGKAADAFPYTVVFSKKGLSWIFSLHPTFAIAKEQVTFNGPEEVIVARADDEKRGKDTESGHQGSGKSWSEWFRQKLPGKKAATAIAGGAEQASVNDAPSAPSTLPKARWWYRRKSQPAEIPQEPENINAARTWSQWFSSVFRRNKQTGSLEKVTPPTQILS